MFDRKRRQVVAVAVVVMVSVAVLAENLDGYGNHIGISYGRFGPEANWAHGWPNVFMIRLSFPDRIGSRWAIDQAPICIFSPLALATDVAIACSLLGGTIFSMWKWGQERRHGSLTFGINTLLLMTTIVAIAIVHLGRMFALDRKTVGSNVMDWPSRFFTHYAAQLLISISLALTAVALLSYLKTTVQFAVSNPRRFASTVMKAVLFSAVCVSLWALLAELELRRIEPPSKGVTFTEFKNRMAVPQYLAEVEDHLVWVGELKSWSLPAGPTYYAFDASGRLVDSGVFQYDVPMDTDWYRNALVKPRLTMGEAVRFFESDILPPGSMADSPD